MAHRADTFNSSDVFKTVNLKAFAFSYIDHF